MTYEKLNSSGIMSHGSDRTNEGWYAPPLNALPLDARTNSPNRFNLVSQRSAWLTHRYVGYLSAETGNHAWLEISTVGKQQNIIIQAVVFIFQI
jgi:hypothetical protein